MKSLKNKPVSLTLRHILKPLGVKYMLNYNNGSYDLIIYESSLDFLGNHRKATKKGFFSFHRAKYNYNLCLDISSYKFEFIDPILQVLEGIFEAVPNLTIYIGTFDYPYTLIHE